MYKPNGNRKNILLIALSLNNNYPPLGLANLKSYALKYKLIQDNFRIYIKSYSIRSFKEGPLFLLIQKLSPVIIGFTFWAWCRNRIIYLSDKIKDEFPNTIIVLGGPEVNEKYSNYYNIDFLIHGRGEISFKKLLEYYLLESNIKDIPSLSFRENGVVITNKHASLKNINQIPSPYLNNIIDLNRYSRPILQAEYGCNRHCYYCDIHKKDKIKKLFSLQRLGREISYILKKSNFLEIINCNLNFNHERFIKITNIIKKYSHKKTKIFLWLDYNSVNAQQAQRIKTIRGEKNLEFEIYIPRNGNIKYIGRNKIIKFSNALSFFEDEKVICHLSSILDYPSQGSKEEILQLRNLIKDNLKQKGFYHIKLHTYTAFTVQNSYDRVIEKS